MHRQGARKRWVLGAALVVAAGCTSPIPPYQGIRRPYAPPQLPPPVAQEKTLPQPPPQRPDPPQPTPETLGLENVLASVERHYPLLLAVAQERVIASGQRLSAEGVFDANFRLRESLQGGSFDNHRLDMVLEQATPFSGLALFGGYRFGFGDFPIYYGDRKTSTGGEFRGGLVLPLLRDSAIDRRRASLRQAQIQENLADPLIQRARLDFLRAATRAYWAWVAAGEQYRVAEALLKLARDRQEGLEEQARRGQISDFVAIDNSRLIVEREGTLIAAERRWQQTAFELSLFWRDENGEPITPRGSQLPPGFLSVVAPPPPDPDVNAPVQEAYARRPELLRLQLQKERVAVELRLAENQLLPAINLSLVGAQDVGKGKSGTGPNAPDEGLLEGAVTVDLPLQRRDARGRVITAQGQLGQLLAQERFARDLIAVEVRDAVSNLVQTYQRLDRAREEQRVAERVAELERDRFRAGAATLLEVNLRELTAAAAQSKVVDTLADYFRAWADFRIALGLSPE
ncbi:MAG: TolC family protein [Gemmataceae bacterium]|nr:TolC family protein [Gemmataceae bacterium]